MSWLGKVFGGAFGFMLGGPLGAILGSTLGHQFDKGLEGVDDSAFQPGDQHRVQMAFFTATFSIMGHIAKADGTVSREEIALANAVMKNMELSKQLRQTAQRLFNQGKSPDFPLNDVLDQFRRECRRRSTLIRMFVEIQLQAAFADGTLDSAEERLLLHICERLNFSQFEYQSLKSILQAQQRFTSSGSDQYRRTRTTTKSKVEDAYAVLGLKPSATNKEIKTTYRRLMNQHHPDKLVAKGLPEEMLKLATEKTQKIRKAYEFLREQRRIK